MIIQDIVKAVNKLSNRRQSRYFSVDEITEAINDAVLDMFNEGRSEFEKTQVVNDLLRVFKTKATIELTEGEGDLPTDYASLTGFEDNIDVVTDERWGEVKNDVICPADSDYPVLNVYGAKVRVLPNTISSVDINYLKKPTKAVYGKTLSENGRDYMFSEVDSTDVEIPAHRAPELLAKTLKYLGVSLKQTDLTQFELLKNQTDK